MRWLSIPLLIVLVACDARTTQPSPSRFTESTLEKAVRHYYDVFNQVRATGDASLIDSVTDPEGLDRVNVREFVAQQQRQHHLSIVTREVFSNWKFTAGELGTKVEFDHQVSGYDIDPQTRQPLESEVTLRPQHIVMELRQRNGMWLVYNRQVR